MPKPVLNSLLLSIGATKAGTTWLYANLVGHRDIYFLPVKEIHYFFSSNGGHNRLSNDQRFRKLQKFIRRGKNIEPEILSNQLRWYADFLSNPVDDEWYCHLFYENGGKHCADFSNSTALISKKGWKNVLRVSNKVKVIYTLRDPLERLWSHIKFHLQFTGRFDEIAKWQEKDFFRFANKKFIRRDGEYAKNIQTALKMIPGSDLKIFYFDDFRQDPLGTLRKLEDFWGLSPGNYNPSTIRKAFNTSNQMVMPEFFPKLFREKVEMELASMDSLGLKYPESWKKHSGSGR